MKLLLIRVLIKIVGKQIRELRDEGVSIGAHSHSHYHMSDLSIDEVKKEIETSNNIFLKELGSIPPLFAFPYGETNEEIMNLLKSNTQPIN